MECWNYQISWVFDLLLLFTSIKKKKIPLGTSPSNDVFEMRGEEEALSICMISNNTSSYLEDWMGLLPVTKPKRHTSEYQQQAVIFMLLRLQNTVNVSSDTKSTFRFTQQKVQENIMG